MDEKITWHLEKRDLINLFPYFKNPRSLTKEQARHLLISIEKFGLIDRPIINLDNSIIGGHQRIHILKELNYKDIDVFVPSRMLSEKEVEELVIRLNKNVGDWDWDILSNEFDMDDLLQWGFHEFELIGEEDFKSVDDIIDEEKEKKEKQEKEKCPTCNQTIKKKMPSAQII